MNLITLKETQPKSNCMRPHKLKHLIERLNEKRESENVKVNIQGESLLPRGLQNEKPKLLRKSSKIKEAMRLSPNWSEIDKES